jgi:ABC-type transporter Mla subunit MlaD
VLRGEESLKLEDVTRAALDVVGKLQNIATNLNRTLGDPALSKSLRTTVANLQDVSENIKVMTSGKDAVAQTLNNLPETLQRVDQLVGKLDEAGSNLKSLTEKSDKLVGENRKNIDAMLQSFRDMAQNLKETTDDVKSHPWKLIRKP